MLGLTEAFLLGSLHGVHDVIARVDHDRGDRREPSDGAGEVSDARRRAVGEHVLVASVTFDQDRYRSIVDDSASTLPRPDRARQRTEQSVVDMPTELFGDAGE
ncbi:Uncharacterised protein [Mycobacteroides abscessus subsp. abscessus]|nr:Uncharacterised protein [Mycobacteroides abscessus subsp. abscessus]